MEWSEWAARTGLAAKGASYGLVGVLAIEVAVGSGGATTSRQGALQTLGRNGLGRIVLILLAAGFAAYALWRFWQAATAREEDDGGGDEKEQAKLWAKRAGYAGRGVVYAALTYSTVRILTGAHQQSQDQKAHHTTAVVLSWPGGTWLVGAAGVVLVGVGVWNLVRGVTRSFEKRWRGNLGDDVRRWGVRAGVAGHVARFVVFALIGVFAVRAAVDYRPQDAIGLDGALQKLAHQTYGPWLLGLTAAGLIAYALYCLVDARLRDVSPSR